MQTFTDDFPSNSMQHLPVNASKSEEEFDFSLSNVAAGVQICNTLDILEKISDYKSDKFTPHDLYLPANSCRIAFTKIQNFEEEENYASTISVDHPLGYDMILFIFDMIFIGLEFQVHKVSVLLVAVLINFKKKQVSQVSYKTAVGDLI